LDDLPPVYKKIVSSQKRAFRPIYEEVSFILENMVRKVMGEGELKPNIEDNRDSVSSDGSKEKSIPGSREEFKNVSRSLPPLEEDIGGVKFEDIRIK